MKYTLMKLKRTERGWAGHFICADRCLFRRNTLLEYDDIKIVVSTIGLMRDYKGEKSIVEIGLDRYYETMAFHSDSTDTRYHDADVGKQIRFSSNWAIDRIDADDEANEMHEMVCEEITKKLLNGDKLIDVY